MKKIIIPVLTFVCGLIVASLFLKYLGSDMPPVATEELSQSEMNVPRLAGQRADDFQKKEAKISELELRIQKITKERSELKDAYVSVVNKVANSASEKVMDDKGNFLFEYDKKNGVLRFDPSKSVVLPQVGSIFLNKADEIAGGLQSTTNDLTQATLNFTNSLASAVDLFWINYAGKPVLYDQLEPGGVSMRPTFITHPWVITDTSGNRLGEVLPQLPGKTETIAIGVQ